MTRSAKVGLDALLTPEESVLVLIDHQPINQTSINTWEDRRVVDAVEKTGRKQLIIAGLWTEICVAMPAIHALADGYDVFVVTDASGGVSAEAHDVAVRRMERAGVVPVTWLVVSSEWQRDWAREGTANQLGPILFEHGGATGVALAWEVQLLATPTTDGGGA
ncbi:isochorismatase family protein [Promicromonospora sp. NPDC050249]|uniref:isochorismatase family protein n=1 Tax=Promicromonospora sp. NPDC050249 TaxID=3154743 RepID=UPI0033F8AB84